VVEPVYAGAAFGMSEAFPWRSLCPVPPAWNLGNGDRRLLGGFVFPNRRFNAATIRFARTAFLGLLRGFWRRVER
jgi:hypothetical protein